MGKLRTVSEKFIGHTVILERGDGIVEVIASDNKTYGVKELLEIHEALLELTQGNKRMLLMISGKGTQVTDEALSFMASQESARTAIAEAYVIQSVVQRIIFNFYLRVKKPKVPSRFFTDQKKAEQWLMKFQG